MKVLQETTDLQTLKIIPREYVPIIGYVLTNESTNTSVIKADIDTLTDSGYITFEDVFTLSEGVFYNLEVYYNNAIQDYISEVADDFGVYEQNVCFDNFSIDSSKLIYRCRIFCTNQENLEKFSINDGEFIQENSYNNEYEIY